MKAAFIERTGPPDVIRVGTLPDPVPGPGQALVRVRACAVNPIDTYVRSGAVAAPLPVPFVVGCDLAGEVLAVGDEVAGLRPGMRVWGSNQGVLGRQGTFAELAAVDAHWLYPTPEGVDDDAAAAAALVSITAHLGLVTHAALRPGETVFVNGASGGVGSAVVQIATAIGARVVGTAGSEAKRRLVRELGADVVLDYRRGDLVDAARAAAPEGIHVYWETQRDPDLDRAVELIAEGGRIVLMAGRDARPAFPVGPFYVKGCRMAGFVMFKADHRLQAAAALDIGRWSGAGRLRVPIDRILPLEATAEAHRLQEAATVGGSGALAGKIVIRP